MTEANTQPIEATQAQPEPVPEPVAEVAQPEPVKVKAKQPTEKETNGEVVKVLEALQGQVKELQAQLGKTKDEASQANERATSSEKSALDYARKGTLDAIGVLPVYHEYAPNADARTEEGKAVLEKWAAERPAMVAARKPAPKVEDFTALGGNVAEIMTGKKSSHWLTPASIKKMLSSKGENK